MKIGTIYKIIEALEDRFNQNTSIDQEGFDNCISKCPPMQNWRENFLLMQIKMKNKLEKITKDKSSWLNKFWILAETTKGKQKRKGEIL